MNQQSSVTTGEAKGRPEKPSQVGESMEMEKQRKRGGLKMEIVDDFTAEDDQPISYVLTEKALELLGD